MQWLYDDNFKYKMKLLSPILVESSFGRRLRSVERIHRWKYVFVIGKTETQREDFRYSDNEDDDDGDDDDDVDDKLLLDNKMSQC